MTNIKQKAREIFEEEILNKNIGTDWGICPSQIVAIEAYIDQIIDMAIADKIEEENYGNPTYYQTIVRSKIWKEWTQYAEENLLFDMAESIECGWLSDEHWEAFINWVRTNENK